MPRQYTKIEQFADAIIRLDARGKTYQKIGEIYGLSREQLKNFM